jgi:hypothetical protein
MVAQVDTVHFVFINKPVGQYLEPNLFHSKYLDHTLLNERVIPFKLAECKEHVLGYNCSLAVGLNEMARSFKYVFVCRYATHV